jgi:PIN domain nuclease of toxin-antitoxin system
MVRATWFCEETGVGTLFFFREAGMEWIYFSITPEHAYAVGDLPMHHQNPFDRMIIAQARLEGLRVVTHDVIFNKYDVPIVEV